MQTGTGRIRVDNKGRDWNEGAASQETPKTANKPPKARKRQSIPLVVSEGARPR